MYRLSLYRWEGSILIRMEWDNIYYRYVTIYISFYILKMTWFFRVFLFIILFFRFCYCSKLAHVSFYKICRIQFSMPKNNIEGHCTTRRKRFINSHFICNNIQFSIWNCNFHFAILVHKILSIYNQINGSTSIRQGICPLGKKKRQNLTGCNRVFDRVLPTQLAESPLILPFLIFS